MKTKSLILAILFAMPMCALADDIIHPASGSGTENKELTGYGAHTNALYINGDKFNSAVAGNKITIKGSDVTSGAKFYFGDYDPSKHLPGSDYRDISSLPVDIYMTEDMITYAKAHDLRIYGEKMTINQVVLSSGKAGSLHDPFKTLWTGYYWMDSWSTLKLFKEALSGIDLSDYAAIRFYYEAGRTNFTMKLFKDTWDEGDLIAANGSGIGDIHLAGHCADLLLTDDVITALGSVSSELHIQCDKGSGAAFNFTDVVLIPKSIDGCDNCFFVTY